MKVGISDDERMDAIFENKLRDNPDYMQMKDLFDIRFSLLISSDAAYPRLINLSISLRCDHIHLVKNIIMRIHRETIFEHLNDLNSNYIENIFCYLKTNFHDVRKVLDNIALKEKLDSIIPNKTPENKRKLKI